ncbi:MAG: clp protease ATP binding subunit [Parcubacteria group bacterium GW2011_GWF2_44_8]|nr:MAG: clp protease ATP binding subunit [Parcubacteria group bacterium GW2011_GWF2_44_8]
MYTIADNITRFKPPITLTRFFSRRVLTHFRTIFFVTAAGAISGAVVTHLVWPDSSYSEVLLGIGLISTSFWLEQMMVYSYHNSFYFFGLHSILGLSSKVNAGATYEVAEALLQNEQDVTAAFCNSKLGTLILLRAGIDLNALETYLRSSRMKITTMMIPLPEDSVFSLITLGQYLLQQDSTFKTFIKEQGVLEEHFLGALSWVISAHHAQKKIERWWGKDELSKTTGIGREWSYGTAYILEKFSRDIRTSAIYTNLTQGDSAFTAEKIAEVEVALARTKASNVLVIGEAGVGKMDLLLEVDRRLRTGKAISAVDEHHMILLDTTRLFATHSNKQELELTILSIFAEASRAGNIIIVIENLSTFIREAESMGVFIPELLDPFLATPALHVIATDTPGAYHTYLEPLGAFARRFAEVLIDTPDLRSTTRVLQGVAEANENRYRVLFTYSALVAITTAADRYIVEGVMPDKAIELMIDISTRASQAGVAIITAEYVYGVVSEKTGIPTGPIGEVERDLLLNLEDTLHERVIGQQRALDAIARTMRRARAGIQSSDKPIGSFLFLGPTGVGKTETAKALAHVFFGSETNMHRIDMSEFSGGDALERLIGDGVTSGILPDMLREHPYSVLLLDELEKANQSVHDIFLQVLDEGIFTDARGDKVNARNTIIIATSNAGSQLILKTIEQRKELSTLSAEIINHIIKEGIFRPELINRFDNTIIFEPLVQEEQGQVAGLMLRGLYERVKDQGYELIVNRDLMDILVEKGYSPQFGARPMQRVIQDVVEEKIAQLIISGGATKGGTIELTRADFSNEELAA